MSLRASAVCLGIVVGTSLARADDPVPSPDPAAPAAVPSPPVTTPAPTARRTIEFSARQRLFDCKLLTVPEWKNKGYGREPYAECSEGQSLIGRSIPWFQRVEVGGLVDTFFSVPLSGGLRDRSSLRVFDGSNGTFQVAYAELNVGLDANPVGFRIDLGFGPIADLTSLEATGAAAPAPSEGASETYKNIQQAFVTFKLPWSDKLTIDAGKFVTTTGGEVIEAKDNWLYSRSFLFGYARPFSHTGVRASVRTSDKLTLQLSVVNGWNVVNDTNAAKTVGLSASWVLDRSPHAETEAILSFYGGKETDGARGMIDLVVTQQILRRVWIHLNVDYGRGEDVAWYGASLMGKFKVSRFLSLAIRGEHFRDPDGVRTGVMNGVALTDITIGAGIPLDWGLELRAEARIDIASKKIFGVDPLDRSSTQPTLQLAALAWF